MEYDFVCFNASHFYDSWNHGQLYAERSWKQRRETSCMDWCWYSCCAYGDWCHPDSSEFTDSEAIRKNVSETERHILGETSQWAGNTDPAVLPYWLVWKGAEWDIYFVPFYNGKDGNSAFVRSGNLCSYFYQYPPIARITGNHQL